MTSSASTDTFPADVAATRRAAGITIAPEAALHRALQERTDELERVRVEWHTEALRLRGRIREVEDERDELIGRVDEVRQAMATIEAAYDRVVSARDEAFRLGAQARAERDEVRAELERVRAELAQTERKLDATYADRDRWREAVAEAERKRAVEEAKRWLDGPQQHVPPTAPDVLTPAEARAVEAVRERDRLDAALRELAGTINEHDDSADLFDSEEESLASVRAVVEEFLRAHGHPVADERATRRFAPPTAPDVGSTTSAPAAGAADPPRPRLMDPHPSERVIAWSRTVFGEEP